MERPLGSFRLRGTTMRGLGEPRPGVQEALGAQPVLGPGHPCGVFELSYGCLSLCERWETAAQWSSPAWGVETLPHLLIRGSLWAGSRGRAAEGACGWQWEKGAQTHIPWSQGHGQTRGPKQTRTRREAGAGAERWGEGSMLWSPGPAQHLDGALCLSRVPSSRYRGLVSLL